MLWIIILILVLLLINAVYQILPLMLRYIIDILFLVTVIGFIIKFNLSVIKNYGWKDGIKMIIRIIVSILFVLAVLMGTLLLPRIIYYLAT